MSSIYTSGNDQYFYSNKIKVFPCAYRSVTYDATARLNTEYNFTHLPHMVDKKSYIIKFNDISENEHKAELICVIQGYYFEIELGTGDYTTLQNKYLNICVASPNPPNGTDFIEGPHLCSWNSSDSVEATLDGKPEGSDYYIFKGLKIGEGALSNGSYSCYALKLDASAKLPISASRIENSAGVPISSEFTTRTLSAATMYATSKIETPGFIDTRTLAVARDKLTANSDNIIANVPVTINNTLEVKTGDTSVLKAESAKVTINKPTDITGTTTINGNTQISKSSSKAADGNLMVAGTGGFGGKLTVQNGGAEITGDTIIKGKATIGTGSAKTEIENNKIKTSKIAVDEILPSDGEKATASKPIKIVVDNNKNKAVEFYSNNEGTASIVKAGTFDGNATTATNANHATGADYAREDANGNVITDTYATTADLEDGTITVKNAENATNATNATNAENATNASQLGGIDASGYALVENRIAIARWDSGYATALNDFSPTVNDIILLISGGGASWGSTYNVGDIWTISNAEYNRVTPGTKLGNILGTSTVGSASKPIYLKNGVPTEGAVLVTKEAYDSKIESIESRLDSLGFKSASVSLLPDAGVSTTGGDGELTLYKQGNYVVGMAHIGGGINLKAGTYQSGSKVIYELPEGFRPYEETAVGVITHDTTTNHIVASIPTKAIISTDGRITVYWEHHGTVQANAYYVYITGITFGYSTKPYS